MCASMYPLIRRVPRLVHTRGRNLSGALTEKTDQEQKCKTGILMINIGGPKCSKEVENYLTRLYLDKEMLTFPFQNFLGPYMARRKAPKLVDQYNTIGGGCPTHKWVQLQGQELINILDLSSPETAPHKYFVGFLHANPFIEDSLEEMEMYGVERAIALPMFPHYSCSTTGNSLNAIFRHYTSRREPSKIVWSTIDRWFSHPAFVDSFAESIQNGLAEFPEDVLEDTIIIFSAHSLPMKNINKGDTYHHEVAASIHRIMEKLGNLYPYIISWQSKMGPISWLGPETREVIESLVRSPYKGILLIPISFISDNIGTLHEIDHDYARICSKHSKIMLRRAECPNDRPIFIKGLAELIKSHLQSELSCSRNLYTQCISCTNEACKNTKDFFKRSQTTIKCINEKATFGSGYRPLLERVSVTVKQQID